MFRRFRRSPQPQLQAGTDAATPHNNSNNKNDDIAAGAATVSDLPNTPQKPHNNNNNDDEAAQPHMPSVRSTSGSDMASHSETDEEDDGHILHAVDHTCKPPLLRPQKSRSTSPAAAAATAATTTTTRVLPSSLPYSSDWSLITSPADLSPPIGIGPTRQQQQQQATTAGHQGSHQPQLFVTVGPPANAEAPNQMEEWATMTPTLSYCHVSSTSPPPNAERQQEEGNEEDERMQGEVHARHDSETTVTTPPPATEVKRRFGMAAAASLLPRSPALSSPMTSLFVRLLPVSPSTETCTSAAHASRCAAPTTTWSCTRPNKATSGVAAPATIVRMPALSEDSVSTETAAQSLEESPFIAASSFAPSMASVLHASESCEPAPRVLSDMPSHESNWTSAGKTRMLRTRSVCGGAGVVSDCVLWLWQAVREDVLYHWYPQLLLVLGNREVRYAGQGRIRHRSKSAMTGRGADGVPRWERRAHKRRRCVSPDACGGNGSEEDIQMSWHWSLSSDTVATAVHSFLIFLL